MREGVAGGGEREGRLGPAEERTLALAIRAAEDEARAILRGVPVAEQVLRRPAPSPERTRAGEVNRIEEAVAALEAAAKQDRSLAERARTARAAWSRAEALLWELALSARHVVVPEARRIPRGLLDFDDLVNEGHIGLLRAAKRFDPERGVRFPTYARWWARAQMTRAIDTGGRLVRLTGTAVEQRRALRRALEREGEGASVADLAAGVGVSEDRARLLMETGRVLRLDAPVDAEGDGRRLSDVLEQEGAVTPHEEAEHAQHVRLLAELVERLPDERMRYVLVRRYGLHDGELRTLQQVADELGLSRERVRQVEARALEWLRRAAFGEREAERPGA